MISIGSRTIRRNQPRPKLPSLPPPPPLSNWSSPAVPDSAWSSGNFLLGAGMLIIQQSTHKILLVYEKERKYYFFPKGRKDVGESLEQAALREAYEESGYQAQFMSHFGPCCAPVPPDQRDGFYRSHSEAIYVTTMAWAPRERRNGEIEQGGEYLTHWYLGELKENAVHHTGTGMPDEVNYESEFFSIEEARNRLGWGTHRVILDYGWKVYQQKLEIERYLSQETATETQTENQGLNDGREIAEALAEHCTVTEAK